MADRYTFDGITPSGEARFSKPAVKGCPRREETLTIAELRQRITTAEEHVAKWTAKQVSGDRRPFCQTMVGAWTESLTVLRHGMAAMEIGAAQ